MNKAWIAVPSCAPGGIDAEIADHFGHCDLFTLVETDNGQVTKVDALSGVPHEHGGCMVPVNLLARHGIKILIAGGMGKRPLLGFSQVGIDVYQNGGAAKVGDAIDAFMSGSLTRFSPESGCNHDEGGCEG